MDLLAAYSKLFPERLAIKRNLDTKGAAALKQKMHTEKLDHLLSGMYRLLETFLMVEEALFDQQGAENTELDDVMMMQMQARQSAVLLKEELLVKALGRHTCYDLYLKASLALTKKLESLPIKNSDDYWLMSQLHHWHYYHPDTRKIQQKMLGFIEATRYLDLCHLLSKLRYAAEWYSYAQIKPI